MVSPNRKNKRTAWALQARAAHARGSAAKCTAYAKVQTQNFSSLRRRNEKELCARLLGVAAHGLHDNTGLIVLVVVSKVVLVFLVLPIFGFLFASYTNGGIVPNGALPG